MLEYEVTYETQNGNHTTINVITSSLIKAHGLQKVFCLTMWPGIAAW